MKIFITPNNILMLECKPLNWRIEKKYAIECDPNPIFYVIDVGTLSDLWQCTLIPETMILSFCSYHYSKEEIYRFKVESIEEASEWVLKFAEGMGFVNDINIYEELKETIYWNK